MLEKLAEEYQGKFLLAKLNSDENQALAQQFGVRSIPTVKAIYKGKLVNEFSGAIPESELRHFIDNLKPSPEEELRLQASTLYQQEDYEQALEILAEAQTLAPDNTPIKIDIASVLVAQENFIEAKTILDQLPLEYKNEDAVKQLLTKIAIHEKSEGLEDIDKLEQSIASNPEDLQARIDLANAYIARKNYPEAIEQCFEIIKIDRDFQDDIGRKTVLDIFTLLGNDDDLVKSSRRRLSSLLY
jgi:putative thioredoxin